MGSGLATYVGFLTAGLAIALSDVLRNLAGWLFIVLRRPFRIGDRIDIGGESGDVLDGFDAAPGLDLAYPTVRTYFEGPIGIEREEC